MSAPTVIVLAAGQGTRMRSRTPKVLHDLCGRPLVGWPVAAALEAGAARVVVVGGPDRALEGHLPDGVTLAVQEHPDGTGGAVRAASAQIDDDATVIVLAGDVPLVTAAAIRAFADAHARGRAAATMLTMELEGATGYGRVIRAADGAVQRVVETKAPGDASPEQLAIREVNSGVFAFHGAPLKAALDQLGADNAQGELYLPDVLPALAAAGHAAAAHRVDDADLLRGVNDRAQLAQVRAIAQARIHASHQHAGVTIVDPASTLIDVGVTLGPDTTVDPSCFLRGATSAGEGCRIGPLTTLIDARLGDDVTVSHSYLQDCEVRDGASVGPFAYLRPGTLLRERAKAGTFVELKNSDIGEGTKVPHLSYLGDADVGPGTNMGAANVTANYDGTHKHRTTIGAGVRTGVDTTFVAPVAVGDGARTGAGAVVRADVPPGALAVGVPARNIERDDETDRPAPGLDSGPR